MESTIAAAQTELASLQGKAGGRIISRKRPTHASGGLRESTCSVYLDECGTHILMAPDAFRAFCLAAVIIPDAEYADIDSKWKNWKRVTLGAETKNVHEPDVRKGAGPFFFGGDRAKRALAVESLGKLVSELEFGAVVCVLNRPAYVNLYGQDAIDESLPHHVYLMMLHFLMERVVMIIDKHYNGAKSRLVAESRGYLEDALLQYEFARLQLDGTSYISASWFRHQLSPGVHFEGKKQNITGLQLADLLARPCGDKVLSPDSDPIRWEEFRPKLCPDTGETANSILGLKIVPWDERCAGIWEAEGAAEATPSADQVKT